MSRGCPATSENRSHHRGTESTEAGIHGFFLGALCASVVNQGFGDRFYFPRIGNDGSPNSMNFIPWKNTLAGYQLSVGTIVASPSRS